MLTTQLGIEPAMSRPRISDADYHVAGLLETLVITAMNRLPGGGGCWVAGTMGGHHFTTWLLPEHADIPEQELADSRIRKLCLRRLSDGGCVADFDRGWDVPPATPGALAVVRLLANGLAELVYPD